MRILICSDGMPASAAATRLGGIISHGCAAETVLLGIVEAPPDEAHLRKALEQEAQSLRYNSSEPKIVIRAGEPIREILNETAANSYDLVVIGAQHKGNNGLYWRSAKTYEVIKAIAPPVLVAIGNCEKLKRFLVCTGGREFIDPAVQLTGKLAAALDASMTLLHVMAEPPAMYSDLVALEEDLDQLLQSKSELGLNLRKQKETLERLGVKVEVRIMHGIVIDQVFAEVRRGGYDLVVTGSSQGRGVVRHYIMGDLTRKILNHAECPVLVARGGPSQHAGFLARLKRIFSAGPG
ncbi:MAG TPA: universal stress protein [Chthoniobacterales bacterium]|jgi:nucleotide-binding universal stress UspA family protein